jgi:hypothetical protein
MCLAVRGASALTEIAPAPRPAKTVRLTLHQLPAEDSLASLRFTERRSAPDPEEMPWIWQALRTKVYSQMPQRETGGISFVMAPVVVVGQFDTVPGFGVSGDF